MTFECSLHRCVCCVKKTRTSGTGVATGDSGSEVKTSQSDESEAEKDDESMPGPSSEVRQRRPATNKQELEAEEVSISASQNILPTTFAAVTGGEEIAKASLACAQGVKTWKSTL